MRPDDEPGEDGAALAELADFFAAEGDAFEQQQNHVAAMEDEQLRLAYKVNREGFVTKRGEGRCADCGATIRDGARVWSVNVQRGRRRGGCWWKCNDCVPLSREELMKRRTIALVRVSTLMQDVESQKATLRQWATREVRELTIVEEPAVSGAAAERPVLEALVADLREGDTLVVTALDRISREVVRLVQTLDAICAKKAHVVSLREGLDFTGPSGRAMAALLGAIAEIERANIASRTRGAVKRDVAGKSLGESVYGRRWGRPRGMLSAEEIARGHALMREPGASYASVAKQLVGTIERRGVRVPWVPNHGALKRILEENPG